MSLKQQLSADLKAAMRAKDALRRTVIRDVMTSVKEAEQRNREQLVKKALEKHDVKRPHGDDPEMLAAYDKAIEAAVAAEDVEAQAELSDSEVLAVIQKLVKQRHDSIADAEQADRPELAANEQAELDILEGYLPQQLTREEIESEARVMIETVRATSMRDMGRVMGPLMDKLQGKADGKLVSEVVREQLSG